MFIIENKTNAVSRHNEISRKPSGILTLLKDLVNKGSGTTVKTSPQVI